MQEHLKSKFLSNEIARINKRINSIISIYSGNQEYMFNDYNSTFDMFNLGIVVFKILAYNLKTSEEIKRDIDLPYYFGVSYLRLHRNVHFLMKTHT